MPSLLAPQGPDLPILWWVWWFVVAFAVYGLLGGWLWMSARRHRDTAPDDRHAEASDRH